MIELFLKGGPIMWPILVASIVALTVALERALFLLLESSRRNPRQVRDMIVWVERGDIPAAIQIGANSADFVARAIVEALK
ncbi:MAG: MotA/TolQ/ExbB proton channel family protein, partial [Verrucomicrobiota bacterium]